MPALSIIADDLTGACDAGAGFARAGLRSFVVLDTLRIGNAVDFDGDVLVYNTESRYLPVDQATDAVMRATQHIANRRAFGGPISNPQSLIEAAWVYKKIDSTLRGHPGEELVTLMRALNVTRALVAPAFPAQGRTTIDAQVLVNGQSLAQTPFAAEAGSGDLRAIFGERGYPVHTLGLDDLRAGNAALAQRLRELRGVIIADAETDADLAALATAAQGCGIRVLCGSAGLAHALPQIMQAGAARGTVARPHGPALVIAGSRHPVTLSQIEVARENGVRVIPIAPEFGRDESAVGAGLAPAQSGVALAAAEHISAGHDVIVTTAGLPESTLGKSVIAQRLGIVAAAALARSTPGVLALTGGDVATAVCAALGAQSLELIDELQPGIALGQLADGAYAGRYVITKAGGFGRPESLWEIINGIRD